MLNEEGESYTLYTLSGVPREAFSKFPMPRNTAVFGPTFPGEGVVRSDDITADPRYGHNAPLPRHAQGPPAGAQLPGRAGDLAHRRGAGRASSSATRRSGSSPSARAHRRGSRRAVAIDNARLHERESRARQASERGAERLRRLLEVADALSRSVSAAEVAEVVVEMGMQEVGADAAALAVLSADGAGFHTLATRGYPGDAGERFRSYPVQAGRPLSDLVIGGDDALLVESFEEWEARYPESAATIHETGYPGFAAVPILARGRPVGAMAFSFGEARHSTRACPPSCARWPGTAPPRWSGRGSPPRRAPPAPRPRRRTSPPASSWPT